MDDGGKYKPSRVQKWLWWTWCDALAKAAERQRTYGADLWVVLNGDLLEGDHHNTSQIISKNPEAQSYVAGRVFGQVKQLKPKRLFVVRGTEAHVGGAGSAEESLARSLGAERDEETHNWSRWHLRLKIHGVLNDFQHHGRTSPQPHLRMAAATRLAHHAMMEYHVEGLRPPDILWRSHTHLNYDSQGALPTRAIGVPSFQIKTAHTHKVAAESISKVGMYHALFREKEPPIIWPQLYRLPLPRIVV